MKMNSLLSRRLNFQSRYSYIPASTYKLDHKPNPQLTLSLSGQKLQPINLNIMLFENVVPKTSQNFRRLLLGTGNYKDRKLSLIGTPIGKLIQRGYFSMGKLEEGNCSIYGPTFRDESFELLHDRPGLLSSISEENSNSSQFAITVAPCPFLDYKNVVFGEVSIESMQSLKQVQRHLRNNKNLMISRVVEL